MNKSYTWILAFIFAWLSFPGFSQAVHFNYNYDSLARQLPLQKTDGEKIKLLLLLVDGSPEFSREPDIQLITYLTELIRLNAKKPLIQIQPYVRMKEGFVQWRKGDYESALVSIKASIDLFDQEKKVIAPLLTKTRTLYNLMFRQEERYAFYKDKLDYYALNGPKENMAACYHGIAGYYNYKAEYDNAISNYLRAAVIFKPFWHFFYSNEMAVAGVTYKRWGNSEKARHYLNIALPLLKAQGDSGNISFCYGGLIDISITQGQYKQAMEYARECIRVSDKTANDPNYAISLMHISNVFLAMGKPDSAYPYLKEVQSLIDKFHFHLSGNDGDMEIDFGFYRYYSLSGDQNKAVTHLLAGYDKAVRENANEFRFKYLRELAGFYEKKQPALSMKYINQYFLLKEAVEKDNQKLKVARFEFEQKESEQNHSISALKQENTIQEATISQRNTILWISLIALFLIAVSMGFVYRQYLLNRKTLKSLRATQRQLITAEKMASLGELTAGIAHEIQNPLNFVNNFAEVSNELIDEMNAEIEKGDLAEAKAIAGDIKQNLEKINQHGKRADAIVKGMLQHSRINGSVKEPTNINALADEYLRLAYHGLRAKDKDFNASLNTDFDTSIGNIEIIPQDIGRVILNLITNALYTVNEKKKALGPDFEPSVSVSTRKSNGKIELRVTDNGNGIPHKVLEKIFQPFFTTKPSGQGTGLGLSLSYDIVRAHGGEIQVETRDSEGTTFIIIIPENNIL